MQIMARLNVPSRLDGVTIKLADYVPDPLLPAEAQRLIDQAMTRELRKRGASVIPRTNMKTVEEVISEWQQARDTAAAADVSAVDAHYAGAAGLPVLAALHALSARLERACARGRPAGSTHVSAAELLAELRPIINLAIGEGVRRAEHAGHRVEVPGVPSLPMTPLLEEILE